MRERNARRLMRLAVVTALLLAVSAPAEASFREWLKRVLGDRYDFLYHMFAVPLVVRPPEAGTAEPDRLMVFDLRAVKASPLPGAPENSWSPVAVDPTTIAVLSGAGHAGGRQEAGIWVYSRSTGEASEVIPNESLAKLSPGASFFALAGPDAEAPGSLIVVARATQPVLHTLVLLANLQDRTLKEVSGASPVDGDPSKSRDVAELLRGSRIRDGKSVRVVPWGDGGGSAPRHRVVIDSLSVNGGLRIDGSLELEPRDGKDCADPNWLSDTEIIYVAKQWPPV